MPTALLAAAGVLALSAALTGCGRHGLGTPPPRPSSAFPHERHLAYFASGQHKAEKVAMHAAIFGAEVPAEVREGKCGECHADLQSRTACASCHLLFQSASLRSRGAERPCIACHRGAWTSAGPAAPRRDTCLACHGPGKDPAGPDVRLARAEMAPPPAAPVRLSTFPRNVYFSHRAHVQFGSVPCGRCHEAAGAQVAGRSSRPFMTMNQCLRCHEENGASTDCLVCHK